MLNRIVATLLLLAGPLGAATRLKELVAMEGVRDNQLIGYGLVVGLAGKGDRQQALFSAQSLANLLQRMGVTVSPSAMQVRNTAAVMLTATLPPYAQPGTRIDVTAAAVGDASTLQGGLLLMAPLRSADGHVYAQAQGPVVTGAFTAGGSGAQKTLNHPTVGRIPNGAIIERPAPTPAPSSPFKLQVHQADFTTASRIAEAINKRWGSPVNIVARAENSALVSVAMPPIYSEQPTEFLAELENLTVEADRPSKVIVNERTGTIVMGKEVRISPVAIMQGNLSVEIQTVFAVSQPGPLSTGTTEVVPQTTVGVKEEKARNIVLKQGATVEELVRALMAIGSTPRDIIAILQSLQVAGALEAEIEVI